MNENIPSQSELFSYLDVNFNGHDPEEFQMLCDHLFGLVDIGIEIVGLDDYIETLEKVYNGANHE